jgi:hypothetical protein
VNYLKKIPFIISTEIKYLGLNLIKKVKDLYKEKYKALMKGILKGTNEKIACVQGLEELICLTVYSAKKIYRFKAIHIKIPLAFFTEI